MGKNHRHTKRLKSEKSKTQLKTATKFLPKGLNVTKTDFKIKPIVILTQLQGKISVEDGKKEVELKDVLSRLKHYNENMKIKACEDLEGVIRDGSLKLTGTGSISIVIQHLSEFMQIKFTKARKSGLSATKTFLKHFSTNEIEPYFHYFSVNLRCAMTHIDGNIQEDSVNFFDVFLLHVPGLIAKHSKQIFPDFLTLISKLKNENRVKRTLSLNLNSKHTSLNWRIIVFTRLYVFLDAIITNKVSNNIASSNVDITGITYPASEYSECVYKEWNALFKPEPYVFGGTFKKLSESDDSFEQNFLQLIPLLYDTWLEGRPLKSAIKGVTYVSDENTTILLSCVVKVFHLIWEYLNRNPESFLKSEVFKKCESLIVSLAQNLPFNLSKRPSKSNGSDVKNRFLSNFTSDDVKCTQENLTICFLYLVLGCHNSPARFESEKVFEYLSSVLQRDFNGSNVNITFLFVILYELLIVKIPRRISTVIRILEHSVLLHEKGNLKTSSRNVLFKLLAKIEAPFMLNNVLYISWLGNCCKLLLEPVVSCDVIDAMFDMSRRCKRAFNQGYAKMFHSIYAHLPTLNVTNTEDPEKMKLKILDILLYVPELDTGNFMEKLDKSNPYYNHVGRILELRNEFNIH